MVSANLADALSNPTRALDSLYKEASARSSAIDFPADVSRHFSTVFQAEEDFLQIPEVDIRHPAHNPAVRVTAHGPSTSDGPLVRFRGMIQETGTPSAYLSQLSSGGFGGWGRLDDIQVENNEPDVLQSRLAERTALWVVNVPGESEWVSAAINHDMNSPGSTRIPSPISEQPHKFPFPQQPHMGLSVQLYDNQLPRITEVVTFVGILTKEQQVVSMTVKFHANFEEEIETHVLHVLFWRPHPATVIPYTFPARFETTISVSSLDNQKTSSIDDLRSELIDWIAVEGLAGDRDAAEWVLLSIISRVYSRIPPILPPALCISSFPLPPPTPSTTQLSETSPSSKPLEPTIKHVLSLLISLYVHIPLSIGLLNESLFAPKSVDEDLHSGMLQLPEGTTVLVSEEGVSEGTIGNAGVINVQTMKECISMQTIQYAFPFNAFSFKTDLNFLILAQGKKSPFVDADINIPLRAMDTPSSAFALYKGANQVRTPSPDKLAAFRRLIGGAKSGSMSIDDTVSQYIQSDFVRERKQGNSVTSEDLILRMTIARPMSLSLHEAQMSRDTWERVKSLDERRKART